MYRGAILPGPILVAVYSAFFMHPPFGLALFYLRSIMPLDDSKDRVTERRIAKVTTGQIDLGAIPFIVIQLVMVGVVLMFPGLVTHDKGKEPTVDPASAWR